MGTINDLGYRDEKITKVIFDESFANARPTSTNYWFGMSNLKEVEGIEHLNTSKVTNMSGMFSGSRSLTNIDLSHFDTSNVTEMQSMFSGCSGLTTLDVSHFDTSNVTNMWKMFYNCQNLTALDLSHFDTSNVTNMSDMFYNCQNLTTLDVSHFDTSKVTDMHDMFPYCKSLKNLDLGHFDTNNVTSMEGMFWGCSGLTSLDLSHFDTNNVTSMEGMFWGCSGLKTIYVGEEWGLKEDCYSRRMFTGCTNLVGGMGTKYNSGYTDGTRAHIDGGTGNPGYLTDIADINAVKPYYVANAEDLSLTFYYDNLYSERGGTIIYNWSFLDTPSISQNGTRRNVKKIVFAPSFAEARPTSTNSWFRKMYSLQEIMGMENLNTSKVTNMTFMFQDCQNLTSLDVSHFDTSNVTSMNSMFSSCYTLTSLDVSHFDTSNVKYISAMFYDCQNLTNLDVSHFDTSNVSGLSRMFFNCSNLTYLDVSHFDTSKVKDIRAMFYNCNNLTNLDVSSFDLSNADDFTEEMFFNCSSLKKLNISETFSIIGDYACNKVGTEATPCTLIVPVGFDFGGVDTSAGAFQWKSGWFTLGGSEVPVIAEMTLDENAANDIPEKGTKVEKVYTVRTLVGGVWNTLCLPFTVTSEAMADESHPLHGATIMTLSDNYIDSNNATHLRFSQVDELTAGVPYVVKVPASVVNPTFSDVTIEAPEPIDTHVGTWQMKGIYSPYTFTQADRGVYFITGGSQFSYVAQPGTMKGMRAYFMLDVVIDFDYANHSVYFDDITGITSVSTGDEADAPCYDLQGRRLNGAPAHGIYISKGKKIVK